MLESFFAPIAFTVIVLVLLGWALARRVRRPVSRTSQTETSVEGESTDRADSERRRWYGS